MGGKRNFFLRLLSVAWFATVIVTPRLHSQNATPSITAAMPGDPLTGNGDVHRANLTYDQLFSPKDAKSPIDDSAFAVPPAAAMPAEVFEGRLDLMAPETRGDGQIVSTIIPQLLQNGIWKHLPHFSVEFVQSGSHLIPVRQGLVITGSVAWNLIIGPGRVWSEKGDNGYTRASFPFSLAARSQNCVHNGSMTFLFSNTKAVHISQVRYQVTQETCAYMKVDMWGKVPATYTPSHIDNAGELEREQAIEFRDRIPRKPLSALLTDYPTAGLDLSAFLRGRKFPQDVTAYGLYLNGVAYVSGCPTRYGKYAFCEEMRLPSYSTAKSAFVGVAMMRLGELYGKKVYSQKLQNYLPQVGQKNSWAGVSFNDAINMATGNFVTTGDQQDERGPFEIKFLGAESYADKMKDALLPFPPKAMPGTVWNYQSHNAFLVTQAMTAYLRTKRGPDADLFYLVRDDVYKPLHVSKGFLTTIRTDDSKKGSPDGYFGLYFIPDDVIKIADFLNNDGGKLNGSQVLDPQRLRESLFRDPGKTGLVVPDSSERPDSIHYNHGFWGKHFTRREYPSLKCKFWVPYMVGYGGISIVLLPNGATFYVFSDSQEFTWENAVLEIAKVKPYCSQQH
jgi:hypothetical protein